MWIFLNDAFVSIVAPTPDTDAAKKDLLVVRARLQGDLQNAFPNVKVTEDKELKRDYRFRALVPRKTVCEVLSRRVKNINYTNFKDSCDTPRHLLYIRVWSTMYGEQERTRPQPKSRKGKGKTKNGVAPHDVGAPYGSDDDVFWDINAKVWRKPYP